MKSLRPYNTFGFDVSARDIVLMHGIEDYLRCVRDSGPRLILGGGSDVLLSEDFPGTVYVMASRGITVERKTADYAVVRFAAGESWKETVEWCLGCGLSGIENLALIPGTCGAAPVQNIGAYGREFADICEYVEIMHEDGTCERLPPEKCGFSYRMSRFKSDLSGCLITAVGLRLSRSFVPHIGYKALQCLGEKRDLSALDVYDKILELRGDRLPDPARIGNAGCFFQNPVIDRAKAAELQKRFPEMPQFEFGSSVKVPAGWLIDKAGLKGFEHERAAVWSKQALVLVNRGGARPQEVLDLAGIVTDRVRERYGIELQPEVRIADSRGFVDPKSPLRRSGTGRGH